MWNMKTPTSSLLKLQMQKNDGRLIKWSHLPFAVNILLNLPDDPERAIISGLVHPCCWISLEEEGGKPTSTESEDRAGSNYPPYLEKQSHKHQPFMKQYGEKNASWNSPELPKIVIQRSDKRYSLIVSTNLAASMWLLSEKKSDKRHLITINFMNIN